ncbi:Coenzyme A biosynthesis bifunctional protein CoaBC [Phycisphaerae bacterium RAS2]|nr:Coenzyme A biosynthesis bifunctional protein CoaBC [Phycisphaerae bacterium RAS2]
MTRRLKILITAGPTREYLDPVRYLSNASTGKMGYAIAAAAAKRGHAVTLVSGPVELPAPPNVNLIRVTSALEMLAAARRAFSNADAAIFAAAVSDWRPRKRSTRKLKKEAHAPQKINRASTNEPRASTNEPRASARAAPETIANRNSVSLVSSWALDLVENPDIAATLGRLKRRPGRPARITIGFALETHDGRAKAAAKLRAKRFDAIVLNSPAAIAADRSAVEILMADGRRNPARTASKSSHALQIVRLLERLHIGQRPPRT